MRGGTRLTVELNGPSIRASGMTLGMALLASVAAASDAAVAPPRIAADTPFRGARAQLAKAGFIPAQIVSPRENCDGAACRTPHPVDCFRSRSVCLWLFVNRADNALHIVEVFVEQRQDGSTARHLFDSIRPADRDYLEWRRVELVLPNGDHRRFIPPPPKPPPVDPPTPLCSEVPAHTLPCWVKPPAGYRGPAAPN